MSSDSDPSLSAFPLSNADALLLVRYGRDIIQDTLSSVVESILLSAYGIFFAVAVYSVIRKGLRTRGSVIMLVVVIYLYAASVIQWALNLTTIYIGIRALLMIPDVPIGDRAELSDDMITRFRPATEGFFVLSMVIGDGVVIWRTWAIYHRRVLVIALPCLLLLMSFIFAIIDITCYAYEGPLPGGDLICPQASLTSWALSVGTNVICTIFVGFKAWQHRRMWRELNLPGKTRKMSTEKILSLLVESGFIYSLLWITQVLSYIDFDRTSPLAWVYQITMPLGHQIAGMYPTLIIVIVNFQCTIWEESPTTISNGTVVFATPSSFSDQQTRSAGKAESMCTSKP
ncbi:hypothetical protein B0H13DRAFT_2340101 [Mycena leptocephala]|nr:hypothetical protein B0H13DRAFT_2340101 [Mycena leptocephala]